MDREEVVSDCACLHDLEFVGMRDDPIPVAAAVAGLRAGQMTGYFHSLIWQTILAKSDAKSESVSVTWLRPGPDRTRP